MTTLLLGLALLVVGGLGIALLELLLRRADVAAALVFGSVLLQAVFGRTLVLVGLGGVMTAVAFVWLGGLQEGSEPVVRSGSGNLSWRAQGWSDVVTAWSRSPADWAVGQPVGSGFTRRVEGIETNTHPHNFYIEMMIRTRVVGLVALIVLTAGLLRAVAHAGPRRRPARAGGAPRPAGHADRLVHHLAAR